MYEIYQRLLDEKGLKNADVSRGTGVSNMTLSDWKRGVSTPKYENMEKIANFLGVTVEYLKTGKESRLSEINANIDYMMLTDDDSRNIVIEYQKFDDAHKEMLKKYMEFLKSDMK